MTNYEEGPETFADVRHVIAGWIVYAVLLSGLLPFAI